MLNQEDKSSWTKIDVTTDKMLTKFITIKGEDVFAKQPYKDLKVAETCLCLKWSMIDPFAPDYFSFR